MDVKRKALYLLVMMVVDSLHLGPLPTYAKRPRYIPDSATDVTSNHDDFTNDNVKARDLSRHGALINDNTQEYQPQNDVNPTPTRRNAPKTTDSINGRPIFDKNTDYSQDQSKGSMQDVTTDISPVAYSMNMKLDNITTEDTRVKVKSLVKRHTVSEQSHHSQTSAEEEMVLEEIQRLQSEFMSNAFMLYLLKEAVEQYEVPILQETPAINCTDIYEKSQFHNMHNIPIAEQFHDFSLLVMYLINDCDELSLMALEALAQSYEEPSDLLDLVLVFIDGLQQGDDDDISMETVHRSFSRANPTSTDAETHRRRRSDDNTSSNIEQPLRNQTHLDVEEAKGTFNVGRHSLNEDQTNDLLDNLNKLSHNIQVFEAMLFDSPMLPNLCEWTVLNSSVCQMLDKANEHIYEYDALPDAQVACEAAQERCTGIMETITYALVTNCTQLTSYSTARIWNKDCSHINGELVHQESRTKRHANEKAQVTVYEHSYFHGKRKSFTETVKWIGREWNDMVSSLSCRPYPCTILAFEHTQFTGKSVLYHGSQLDLSNFGDTISSLLVLPYAVCVTVYEHNNFLGRSHRFCGDASELSTIGFNDEISSLSIECGHCSALIYENVNYSGRFKSFRGKVSFVGHSWNDVISSIRIRPYKSEVSSEKEGCTADPAEARAYSIIQWIPVVSLLYSLASAAYYGAIGCSSVAIERAKDMAVDLAMDIAMAVVTVVTAGTATAGVYAVKTAVKSGVKFGVKAFGKAISASAKAFGKAILTRAMVNGKAILTSAKVVVKGGFKGVAKRATKSLTNLVKTVKAVKNVPTSVVKKVSTSGNRFGKAISNLHELGVKKSLEKAGVKIKAKIIKQIDDMAATAQRNVDDINGANVAKKIRCRRKVGGCESVIDKLAINDKTNDILNKPAALRDAKVRFEELVDKTPSKYNANFDAYNEAMHGYPPIDRAEFKALSRMTTTRYKNVNTALRVGCNTNLKQCRDLINEISVIKSALKKYEPKVTDMDRLIRIEPEWTLDGMSASDFYQPNKEIQFDSFIHTSKNADLNVEMIPGGKDWERYYKLKIKSESGVDMTAFVSNKQRHAGQAEVLLPAGTKFKVTSVKQVEVVRGGKTRTITEVELDEIK